MKLKDREEFIQKACIATLLAMLIVAAILACGTFFTGR